MPSCAHRFRWALLFALTACPAQQLQLNTRPVPLGAFSEVQDINTALPGFAEFRPGDAAYRLGGGGSSITGSIDGLRFASVRRSGSFSLGAELHLDAPVANAQASAMLLIRQGLEPRAAFAALCYQADGRLLYLVRRQSGSEVQITALTSGKISYLGIARQGDRLQLTFAESAGQQQHRYVELPAFTDPVYVGLGVSAHTPYALQAATFSQVHLSPPALRP